jgi:hypothetical protein
MKTNKKRRLRLTENQLIILVQLIQEGKKVQENKEKMSKEDKRKFEELRLKKVRGEDLSSDDKQFLKKYENLWQKTLNLMRADPKGFSATKGFKGMGDQIARAGENYDLYDLFT